MQTRHGITFDVVIIMRLVNYRKHVTPRGGRGRCPHLAAEQIYSSTRCLGGHHRHTTLSALVAAETGKETLITTRLYAGNPSGSCCPMDHPEELRVASFRTG